MTDYRCQVCGWTWGDDRALEQTRCPVERHHKRLLKAKQKRAKAKDPEMPVPAGSIVAIALGIER